MLNTKHYYGNGNNWQKELSAGIDEIENKVDVSNIQEFISECYVKKFVGEHYEIGIKGAIDHTPIWRRAYPPDLKLTLENQISERE